MSLFTLLIVYISLHHCPLCWYCLCPCVTVHNVNIVYVPVPLFIMLILFLSLYLCPRSIVLVPVSLFIIVKPAMWTRQLRSCAISRLRLEVSHSLREQQHFKTLLICQTLYWKFSTHLKCSVSRMRKTNPAQCFKKKTSSEYGKLPELSQV